MTTTTRMIQRMLMQVQLPRRPGGYGMGRERTTVSVFVGRVRAT
jgi:hypothetical protein